MLPERIAESIDQWFEKDYRATFYERIDYLVESEPLFAGLPLAVRYARTLEYILERISVFLQPGEKIVGSVREIIPAEEQAAWSTSCPASGGISRSRRSRRRPCSSTRTVGCAAVRHGSCRWGTWRWTGKGIITRGLGRL